MMEYQQRTVRIFVSSTFRDFQQEQGFLFKKVFPEHRQHSIDLPVELAEWI